MPGSFRWIVPIFLALSSAACAPAQHPDSPPSAPPAATPDPVPLGQGFLALNGPWKFQTGDSPAVPGSSSQTPLWATPNFDDSSWETVDLTPQPGFSDPFNGDPRFVPGWTANTQPGYAHPGYMGWAWYRIRVSISTTPGERLAINGPLRMTDAYQVFVNGALIGSFGDFSSGSAPPVAYFTHPMMFPLPLDPATKPTAQPAVETIAFRVWMGPVGLLHSPDSGGLNFAPLLGESSAIAAQHQLEWHVRQRELTYPPVEAALLLLLAIIAASLTFFDRSDPVYLWAAGILVIAASADVAFVASALTFLLSSRGYFFYWEVFVIPLYLAGWVMVWRTWFRLRRPAWLPRAIAILTLAYMASEALRENFLFFGVASQPLGTLFKLTPVVVRLVFLVFTVLIVAAGIRKQGREGWLVLTVIVPLGFALFTSELIVLHLPVLWHPFGYDIFVGQIADLFLVIALTVLLLRRLLLSVHRQRLLAGEWKNAQEMQQVLIPAFNPDIPGFILTSAYTPASEVGGDFYQIIPLRQPGSGTSQESTLIVLGDVSGKGLKAAMAVSLIVGMIRALADFDLSPGELLTVLNDRLLGRLQGGFTTCIAIRLESDGSARIASAGHPSPLLNGAELTLPGAFPLGLAPGVSYEDASFVLKPQDHLAIYTDGLLEARSQSGELYGFNRINKLFSANPTAAQATQAAVAFGQDDDITVLTLIHAPGH